MTGTFRDLKVDFGHIILIALLVFVIFVAVKKVNLTMGVCACPKVSTDSVKEGMSNLNLDYDGMCCKSKERDIGGYGPSDYTPLY